MRRFSIGLIVGVMGLALGCGPNTGGVGGSADDSGSETGTDTDNSGTGNGPTTATSNGSAEGTGSTGSVDGSTGEVATTAATTDDPGTTTDATSAGSESSSGGPPDGPAYPECMPMSDPPCPEPYEMCWPPGGFMGANNFCTLECEDVGQCPDPTSGKAVPVCEGPPDINICVLDCSMGSCPDGMDCVDVFNNGQFLRCIWP